MKRCNTCGTLEENIKKRRIILPPLASSVDRFDRLTNLPDEILGRILSLLPTKDVAAMQVLSKRTLHALSLVTSLDLDDSPISHSDHKPYLVDSFPLFKSFVTNVLHKLSRSDADKPLTRFKLCFGTDRNGKHWWYGDKTAYLPYLEPACLNGWISYPLAHIGLRDLDLNFHIKNRNECKLPTQLFDCRSLESFRLDTNILIDDVDIPPLTCFPNLKLVHIDAFMFPGNAFVTRLVSSCPVLEDLSISGSFGEKLDRVTISSHSLRKLVLGIRGDDMDKRSDLVLIDTPNLQYLSYSGTLAYRYSVTHMNALVEAKYDVDSRHIIDDFATCFWIQLSFLSALSNVQHLYLCTDCIELISSDPELKDELPVFHNLRTLKLGNLTEFSKPYARWDILLLLILRSSPLLETLAFPRGLRDAYEDERDEVDKQEEAEGWRINQTLPPLSPTHLTGIEIGYCLGEEHELNLIKFVLSKASALKELVISFSKKWNARPCQFEEFLNKLGELPRASNSCSIIVEVDQ